LFTPLHPVLPSPLTDHHHIYRHHMTTTLKVEYFYNVETQRTKMDKPKEGYMWERKLELLKQLTPRAVDPTSVERGFADPEVGHPDRWKWRETEAEKRKRFQFLKAKDAKVKADEKRRREAPTKREQVKRDERRCTPSLEMNILNKN
jgi:hypothetical protein